ncbi:MAG: HoxN/HupN/NixA family nickel/cobalt transporter [Thermoplasmata archaeon]|jgi:high-affinity nickel-transport protein
MPARRPVVTALDRGEKAFIGLLYTAIIVTTIVAFLALIAISAKYQGSITASATTGSSLFALGVLSYLFGLRHGVDADHIAAIDNTTRKLLNEGKRPLTVGTWFSLGHSTIVVGMIVAIVFFTSAAVGALPALQGIGSILGTLISGAFLWIIGIINVIIAVEIYRVYRAMRSGRYNEQSLEEQLNQRGFMNRVFGKFFKIVQTPRQIYPIGVLFGLGFDTASEIAVIALSVTLGVSGAVPLYVVLVYPLLFMVGMVLVDTSDGIAMRFAYGWAFLRPVRKVYYNLTVTITSILIAFVIGSVELLQVLSQELNLTGPIWDGLKGLDFETVGYLIIGVLLATWGIAYAYYRYKRLDQMVVGPDPSSAPPPGHQEFEMG